VKLRAISLLLAVEVAAMSLWFVSAAVLPEMSAETDLTPFRQAVLSSGVQAGFVLGALLSAVLGLADRFDPRRVLAASAICAGLANAVLLVAPVGGAAAILARFATGACLAGVYPVGMKIAVGWGSRDRGLLVGLLVGALTVGSAFPHFFALMGGADWRATVAAASLAAGAAGIVALFVGLGPLHARAPRFEPRAILLAWTNRRVRLAYAGYLGHMWELYAMWAWIATAMAASYGASLAPGEAHTLAKWTAFVAIACGGLACAAAGSLADRIGKAQTTIIAMAMSGACAVLSGATFGGPVWLSFAIVLVWGTTIVPDSAQFSALVADAAPPQLAGSLMTFQTALGFALTFATVQATPVAAHMVGWPIVLASLAIGPALGIIAMNALRTMAPDAR
jgi:MFS family permease